MFHSRLDNRLQHGAMGGGVRARMPQGSAQPGGVQAGRGPNFGGEESGAQGARSASN